MVWWKTFSWYHLTSSSYQWIKLEIPIPRGLAFNALLFIASCLKNPNGSLFGQNKLVDMSLSIDVQQGHMEFRLQQRSWQRVYTIIDNNSLIMNHDSIVLQCTCLLNTIQGFWTHQGQCGNIVRHSCWIVLNQGRPCLLFCLVNHTLWVTELKEAE